MGRETKKRIKLDCATIGDVTRYPVIMPLVIQLNICLDNGIKIEKYLNVLREANTTIIAIEKIKDTLFAGTTVILYREKYRKQLNLLETPTNIKSFLYNLIDTSFKCLEKRLHTKLMLIPKHNRQ